MEKQKYFKVVLEDEKTGKIKFEVQGLAPLQVISLCTNVINIALNQQLKATQSAIVKPTIGQAIGLNKQHLN